jgi:hypothetical protein
MDGVSELNRVMRPPNLFIGRGGAKTQRERKNVGTLSLFVAMLLLSLCVIATLRLCVK